MAIKETTDTNRKLCIRNYKHRDNGHFNLSEKKISNFIYLFGHSHCTWNFPGQ